MVFVPIGISDFKEIRESKYYYVDKSMLIAEVLHHPAKVLLLPRPRRFGKTLNLSMLYYFLSKDLQSSPLFDGLSIENDAKAMVQINQYPTICLTFNEINDDSWTSCFSSLLWTLGDLFREHQHAIEIAQPEQRELDLIQCIKDRSASPADGKRALSLLVHLLYRATGQRVIVLIDEYDTPVHAGYLHGYYSEVTSFMRGLLGGALKDNRHLEKGVITGILRVARESIFSGLNNIDVFTVLDDLFSTRFGFTESEVKAMLVAFGQENKEQDIKAWFNGYRFGHAVIYNPWSIIKAVSRPDEPLQAHWLNTSNNLIISNLIVNENALSKTDLELLLGGDSVRHEISPSTALEFMAAESVWSLMLFSGYLMARNTQMEAGRIICDLAIPNREVRSFYQDTVRILIQKQLGYSGLKPLLDALRTEDFQLFSQYFSEMVKILLSFHDTVDNESERVYHAFLLGTLAELRGEYQVFSNRESGYGRFDICLQPQDQNQTGFIFELKRAAENQIDSAAAQALNQIAEKDYTSALCEAGISRIQAIGIGLCRKRVAVAHRLIQQHN